MIFITATTLLHKSTLSTKNFGNNDLWEKYQKQNIFRIFGRSYWCLFEKFSTNRVKISQCVFGEVFNFLRIS